MIHKTQSTTANNTAPATQPMLHSNQIILEEFKEGDFDTRLSLMLNYRDLRKEFALIEEKELARLQTA